MASADLHGFASEGIFKNEMGNKILHNKNSRCLMIQ